jgi:hypothetical protein
MVVRRWKRQGGPPPPTGGKGGDGKKNATATARDAEYDRRLDDELRNLDG